MKSTNLALAALFAACLTTAGCNKYDEVPVGSHPGPVTFAITDAANNDVEIFEVDVTSVALRRLVGPNVSALAAPIRVDLASLASTSNFLAGASVPFGTYTGAIVTIDLNSARCVLVGKTTPAVIKDANGVVLTGRLNVPLQLDAPFTVTSTVHHLLELDFDLNQSLVVDRINNVVSLEPSFVLRVDPVVPRDIGTMGTLTSVDEPASLFNGVVRSLTGAGLADVVFHVSDATVFQIDGVTAKGAAGLTALSALPVDAPIQCFGAVTPTFLGIDVKYVEAGSGSFNGGTDIIEGHIVGRTGGAGSDAVLEVLGHSTNAAHTTFQYGTTFLVDTSFTDTKVTRRNEDGTFDVDDLNIGQLVRVFGTLSGTTMSADTQTNVIRMLPTRVFGLAAGAPDGPLLTLDLSRVGLLGDTAFNWLDGGFTPANPNAFIADVGLLGEGLEISVVSSVIAIGYFSGIEDVGPDFTATALVNQSTAAALVFVRNRPNVGLTALVTANAQQIQLNLVGPPVFGEFAFVDRGFIGAIPLPTFPTPTLNHPAGTGNYSLRDRTNHTVRVFTRFSDFASALQSDIAMGATLVQLAAIGDYTQLQNSIDTPIATAVVD